MCEKWIDRMAELLEKKITEDDFLIVKLLRITVDNRNGTPEYTTSIKACPARIVREDDIIVWHINDMLDDNLIIESSVEDTFLGSDENVSYNQLDGMPEDDIYDIDIILKCKLFKDDDIKWSANGCCRNITDTDNQNAFIIKAGLPDISAIENGLKKCGINIATAKCSAENEPQPAEPCKKDSCADDALTIAGENGIYVHDDL